jgi:hypothetical protein
MLCFWFGGGVNYNTLPNAGREWVCTIGGTGGGHKKNDGSTLSITNAGAKCPTF